jgi:hypothetical protein
MTTQFNSRHDFESHLVVKAWKDESFKRELINNPKAVVARESGKDHPADIEIRVLEETPNTRYIVIPNAPSSMQIQELSEEALDAVAGGAAQANFVDFSFVACG